MSEMMLTNSLVKIKEAPPYTRELEERVLLNPMARATLDLKTGNYSFTEKLQTEVKFDLGNVEAMKGILMQSDRVSGVGVDHGTLH
jgi:fatty acid synthase subunit alpha